MIDMSSLNLSAPPVYVWQAKLHPSHIYKHEYMLWFWHSTQWSGYQMNAMYIITVTIQPMVCNRYSSKQVDLNNI